MSIGRVAIEADPTFDIEVPVAIIGAGAAGLVAALACRGAGVEPLVLERDAVPRGSTSLSAGLIPAAGTRFQREHGIEDDAATFARDIQKKAHGQAEPVTVRT
jgi:fumarate reductase flavoprotein subunit